MEKYLELQENAKKYLKNADQGLNFTYPLVKDNKVLLSVVNNLFLSLSNAMGSLLYHELLYKRVPIFQDNFESKFQLMRSKVAERYNIDKTYLKLMRDLKDIIISHNESPIEFSRGNRFIICGNNYEIKEVNPETLKKAIGKTKLFIDEIIHIIKNQI
jgi:nitrogen-specific signal transduction histidine kinase